ncbi:Phosphoribosylglycinamide formyltransferase [uncultured archaeon]|nr:Phosphoribosylglycinamide formyltransferase [uncultured archaeon]
MGRGTAKKLILGVLGSTRGTDLQAIIDAAESGALNAKIALVVSDKKDAFIIERAKKHGIETLFSDYKGQGSKAGTEKVFAQEFRKRKVDLVLLIGFMKILSPYFVREFRHRIWNIHPSLLPKYAGGMNMDVHAQVIANREKETGCTLHEVSEEVDAGQIIMQKKTNVTPNDTPDTLKKKVQNLEQECFLEAIKMVIEGKLVIGEPSEN